MIARAAPAHSLRPQRNGTFCSKMRQSGWAMKLAHLNSSSSTCKNSSGAQNSSGRQNLLEESRHSDLVLAIGALLRRILRFGERVLGAAVEIELPVHLGGPQLLDH